MTGGEQGSERGADKGEEGNKQGESSEQPHSQSQEQFHVDNPESAMVVHNWDRTEAECLIALHQVYQENLDTYLAHASVKYLNVDFSFDYVDDEEVVGEVYLDYAVNDEEEVMQEATTIQDDDRLVVEEVEMDLDGYVSDDYHDYPTYAVEEEEEKVERYEGNEEDKKEEYKLQLTLVMTRS